MTPVKLKMDFSLVSLDLSTTNREMCTFMSTIYGNISFLTEVDYLKEDVAFEA